MISIIIPAYNEETRMRSTLDMCAGYFLKRYPGCEILVICDGHDATAGIVRELSEEYSGIFLFEYRNRLGKGGGITEGFRKAKGDSIAFVDADGSVSPEDLEKIIRSLDDADCAIGSRRLPESIIVKKQPFKRRITSRAFNVLVNVVFDLKIHDTQCGAKAFRKDVITSVLPEIKSRGFEFDVELLWRIKKKGFSIREVPIAWQHTENSRFSLKHAPSMFRNLMKIRLET